MSATTVLRPSPSAKSPAASRSLDAPVRQRPNAYEYSIADIVLSQGGNEVNGSVDHDSPLDISWIVSPANNSVQVLIYYLSGGIVTQYSPGLLAISQDANTGAGSTTLSTDILGDLKGKQCVLELSANGPVVDTGPVSDRSFQVT